MKFIDEYQFDAAAGNGGNGVVRWRHEKFMEFGGPSGGNGGRGGDVYVEGVRDIRMLSRLIHTTSYKAERGQDGGKNSCSGRDGEDVVLKFPIGSIIKNHTSGATYEVLNENERILLLKGGLGGLGNEHYKSSSNQSPREHTLGGKGEEGMFEVELRLIADAGFVGLPNAGKTSLLNALTNAAAKVASYEFTTLDPNLGAYHAFVLADIPGLIAGAAEGKGLGHKFLRHVSRTKLILHCISLERENPYEDYETVTRELEAYFHERQLPTHIVLTKSDSVTSEVATATADLFKEKGFTVSTVSVLDDASLKVFGDTLTRLLTH